MVNPLPPSRRMHKEVNALHSKEGQGTTANHSMCFHRPLGVSTLSTWWPSSGLPAHLEESMVQREENVTQMKLEKLGKVLPDTKKHSVVDTTMHRSLPCSPWLAAQQPSPPPHCTPVLPRLTTLISGSLGFAHPGSEHAPKYSFPGYHIHTFFPEPIAQERATHIPLSSSPAPNILVTQPSTSDIGTLPGDYLYYPLCLPNTQSTAEPGEVGKLGVVVAGVHRHCG